ncbi:MAG: ATP-binding protein [Verrucomicrobiales bacterium]|nr:ATP-binding protein [Verrucomicrobiales bacterium]
MIRRDSHNQVRKRLKQFPAVALLGPRQVGKTTLAHQLAEHLPSIYLDLESHADRAKLIDPTLYLSEHEDKLIILDEVHRLPGLFQELRGIIDAGKRKGLKSCRFLLLGSASIDLLRQSGESLAGRISYVEMYPLSVPEIDCEQIDTLWVRGGFPDSFLETTDEKSFVWREDFIRTYLERDIPELGPRIPAETLRRFWSMLAHCQGGVFNAAHLARSLSVDSTTVARYLDLLVDLLLVRRLTPIHRNTGKRLVKSPKVYIRDSGIVHALLGLPDKEKILGHPVIGMSWEGFVIENLIQACPDRTIPGFYRTSAGSEIDLVLEKPDGTTFAIEVKRGLSPKISKGFYHAIKDINPAKSFIVYSGKERYPIAENIEMIPLPDLIQFLTLGKTD